MKVSKYPSIINDYAVLKLKRALEFMNENWFATEKLDGTNVSINLDKNYNILLAGKRQKAEKNPSFYQGLFDFVDNKLDLIDRLKNILHDYNADIVRLYGELYGAKIRKADYTVNKNNTTDVKFFTVIIEKEGNKVVLSRETIEKYLEDYLIPISKIDTLKNLLETDIENQKSQYGNTFEGYVYAPFDFDYELSDNAPFLAVKHKTEKFQEVKSKNKLHLSKEQLTLNDDVNRYVTKQRIEHVLNEHQLELIERNFGKIINATKEDIKKEYLNENDVDQYTDEQIKYAIKGQSREIVQLMKEMMRDN